MRYDIALIQKPLCHGLTPKESAGLQKKLSCCRTVPTYLCFPASSAAGFLREDVFTDPAWLCNAIQEFLCEIAEGTIDACSDHHYRYLFPVPEEEDEHPLATFAAARILDIYFRTDKELIPDG